MIIIGAGAAGLFSAVEASKKGIEVIVLERNDRPGKKLLATGNGRCNYTNTDITIDRYHGKNKKFAYSAISKFNYNNAVDWFEDYGIVNKLLSKGRAYPRSLQSSSILEVLLMACRNNGVKMFYNSEVGDIKYNDEFEVICTNGRVYKTDSVIVATGGSTLAKSGSDGSGYKLAKKLGHNIIPIGPSIVQMELKNPNKKLSGTRFDAGLYLDDGDENIAYDLDEVLFTDYGISGPAVLQLSGRAIEILQKGGNPKFRLDLFPELSLEELVIKYVYGFSIAGDKNVLEALVGSIHKNIINYVVPSLVDSRKRASSMSYEEIQELCFKLKNCTFEIKGPWKFDGAQVTTGGVDTTQIDPTTMESKLIKGLYFTGEVMDIDGDCGGFNLHWAWASSYAAANAL